MDKTRPGDPNKVDTYAPLLTSTNVGLASSVPRHATYKWPLLRDADAGLLKAKSRDGMKVHIYISICKVRSRPPDHHFRPPPHESTGYCTPPAACAAISWLSTVVNTRRSRATAAFLHVVTPGATPTPPLAFHPMLVFQKPRKVDVHCSDVPGASVGDFGQVESPRVAEVLHGR